MKPERKKRSRDEEHSGDARDRQAQEIERLKQENERLRKELAEREKKIADLERQLALRQQNSATTSKPPSSDGVLSENAIDAGACSLAALSKAVSDVGERYGAAIFANRIARHLVATAYVHRRGQSQGLRRLLY